MLEETDPKFPLPPCRICKAPGAGFHYGVNTCEACKGFFHRSLSHWPRYKCLNKGKCTIQQGQGKMCRLCRYQKCLDTGMSKSAIKTGRYNYKKKTDDILEVKKMTKALAKDCDFEMTPIPHHNVSSTHQRLGGGSRDTEDLSNNVVLEGSTHVANQELFSPISSEDTRSKDSLSPKLDHRIPSYGINSDTRTYDDNLANSTPEDFNYCNNSSDSFSQNTPESLVPASPTCQMISELSTPASPSLLITSSSSLPAQFDTSPPSSSIEGAQILNLECSPVKKRLQSEWDHSIGLKVHKQDFLSFPSTSSFQCIQSNQPLNLNIESNLDSTSNDNFAPSSPIAASTVESYSLTDSSQMLKTNRQSPESCPSVTEHFDEDWLREVEAKNSIEIDNEIADSSFWKLSDVEALFHDYDKVVNDLVDAHKKYINQFFQEIPQDELEKQQKAHYEACVLRKQMFGHIRRLPDHEYDQLYDETGIDADNRGKRMRDYAKAMEDTIWAMVSFAMVIPGFRGLSKEAKQNLIKYSRQEFCLLNLFKYVNSELKVYRGVENDWQCSLEMENSEFRKTLDSVFLFLRKFKVLELTHEQCVILRALIIMAPDRTSLTNSKVISAIHDQLVKILIYLLGKQFDRPMLVFARIMCLVTELRTKAEETTEMFKKHNLIRYMPISDKPFIQLMYSGIYM